MADKAVPRNTVLALRETIARIENEKMPGLMRTVRTGAKAGFGPGPEAASRAVRKGLALGVEALDRVLEGGLPLEGLSEIRTSQTRSGGAGTGFVLALAALCQQRSLENATCPAVLWIGQPHGFQEAGLPYGVGLQAHGLEVDGFLLATPRTVQDALWIADAALAVPAFAAVVLEVRGNPACLGLSESRRLHVRARAGGLPLLLLRLAGEEEASSALFRLRVEPAPARLRVLPDGSMLRGSIGNPVFHVTAEKSRVLSPAAITLEWNPHDRRFYPVDLHPAATAAKPSAAHPVAGVSASSGRSRGTPALGHVMAFKRAS